MGKCASCNTTILFGGVEQGTLHYCNRKCAQRGALVLAAQTVSDSEALLYAARIHAAGCPKCGARRPADMHSSYQILSALYFSQWKTTPQLSCRRCGVKAQLGDLSISLLFGWWGIPWGIIMTPVQIGRNIVALLNPPAPDRPSPALLDHARLQLAAGQG